MRKFGYPRNLQGLPDRWTSAGIMGLIGDEDFAVPRPARRKPSKAVGILRNPLFANPPVVTATGLRISMIGT
ncbi:hypothetical protein ACQZ6F_15905 [Rhizobium sp. A22-96]